MKTRIFLLIKRTAAGVLVLILAGCAAHPPQQGQLRPYTGGTVPCCNPVCGFINFNNSNSGFSLAQGQKFTLKLSKDSAGQNLVSTNQYCVQWRYGGQPNQAGCCTTISATQEQFTAPVRAAYALTVYFLPVCAAGTIYYLWPDY
jgi:hypothetical protein